mmetsp:Transcript_24559/g.61972  ORF Transcript_24559/g.61972 Transcript_24559/m.61972 type:complete len:203 (-) Transcript_24559:1317-1925(-)
MYSCTATTSRPPSSCQSSFSTSKSTSRSSRSSSFASTYTRPPPSSSTTAFSPASATGSSSATRCFCLSCSPAFTWHHTPARARTRQLTRLLPRRSRCTEQLLVTRPFFPSGGILLRCCAAGVGGRWRFGPACCSPFIPGSLLSRGCSGYEGSRSSGCGMVSGRGLCPCVDSGACSASPWCGPCDCTGGSVGRLCIFLRAHLG